MSARLWWRGWNCPWSLGCNEIFVTHRFMHNGEFEHSVKHHPAAARTATIEAEDELVQVVGQVRPVHGTLVSTQQPSLGQRSDSVYSRQQILGVFRTDPSRTLTAPLVNVAELIQPTVA